MTHSVFNKKLNAVAAAGLLTLAAILAGLIFVDRWTSIAVDWPGFWYRSRSFHLLICMGLILAAWWAHRCAGELPDPAAVVFNSVKVYSKPNCELCDRAIEILHQQSAALPAIEVIDISGHAELEQQHGRTIPVVEMDGRIRFRGIISVELLERMISARQRQRWLNKRSQKSRSASPETIE